MFWKIHEEINRELEGRKKNDFGKLRWRFAFIEEKAGKKSNFQFPNIERTIDPVKWVKRISAIFSSLLFVELFFFSVIRAIFTRSHMHKAKSEWKIEIRINK